MLGLFADVKQCIQERVERMNRVVKYDVLRVVACLAIVLLHVSASYWSVVDIHGSEFVVMTIYNSMTRFAVPVFFMLSGLFLVSPDRENVAVGKRILKVVLLFYIWSAFYAFQGVAIDAICGEFSEEVWKASVERFIFGHIHMWFLQVLVGFYILIPVARGICAKEECVRYYLFVWVIFHFIIPHITDAFQLITLQARVESLGLHMLADNFGYFLLGYYLNRIDIKREVRRIIYAMGIICVAATAFLTVYSCKKAGTYVETWFSPGAVNILIMCVAIFTFFKYCKMFENTKRVLLWQKLSRYTFFVYMFHMFVIEKLNLVGITTVSFPAIISIPVLTLFTFAVSMVGAFIADHIPGIKKIVMLH